MWVCLWRFLLLPFSFYFICSFLQCTDGKSSVTGSVYVEEMFTTRELNYLTPISRLTLPTTSLLPTPHMRIKPIVWLIFLDFSRSCFYRKFFFSHVFYFSVFEHGSFFYYFLLLLPWIYFLSLTVTYIFLFVITTLFSCRLRDLIFLLYYCDFIFLSFFLTIIFFCSPIVMAQHVRDLTH